MKTYLYIAILGCIVSAAARAAERPNIVFMLSDDQAWNGLSVPMHPDLDWAKSSIVETPNLERMAAQGMRFSAAYAPASACSPTRISLQTGKSSAAMHWTKAAPGRLAFFDVEADFSEQNDLAQQMPQKVRELDSLLVNYLGDVDAQMATPYPNYDPSIEPVIRKGGGGGNKTKKEKPNRRNKQ